MNIKAVLFDVDDTLFDRNTAQSMVLELIVKRLPHVFSPFKMEIVLEAFIESDRITVEEFEAGAPSDGLREARSRLFLRLLGIREDYADTITDIYLQDYPTLNAPVPGAISLVKELSRRFQVGVVSNGLSDVQYRKLEAMGLRDVFSCIVLSEEIGIRKPSPEIFNYAAGLLRLQPQECLYVGDSYTNDIIGVKAAGMLTCWLIREMPMPKNESLQADIVISNLEELAEILGIGSGTCMIRAATAADADQINEIHTRSVRELCKEYYTPEQITGWLKDRTPDSYLPGIERGEIFVAVEGAIIVGFGHAVPGEIRAIYVAPEYVRQGIGMLLLANGIAMARHGSQSIIRLDSSLNAVEFYAQAGFIEIGRKSIKRNDMLLPVIGMELRDKI